MAGLYVGQKEIGTGPLGRREVVQEMHIPGCQYIRGDTDENLSGSISSSWSPWARVALRSVWACNKKSLCLHPTFHLWIFTWDI